MSDVRTILERGVGGATPPPDGLERMLRRRDRKRRNQRLAAGAIGIAVFVAAVWFVTSAGPAGRGQAPAGTGPTVTPADPGQVGLVGLAPEGMTPSSPSRGELVVGFMFGHTSGDPGRFGLHVYADGRVIWQELGSTGLVEQQLTPEGVELLRSEVLAIGPFREDVSLVGAYGLFYGQIEVRRGDRLVHLSWGDIGTQASVEMTATLEQIDALQALDARLEDLASWLPASAWADPETRPYVPSRYSLCFETGQDVGLTRVLASLPRRAEDMVRAWDLTYRADANPDPPEPWYLWCSAVTAERARALAEVLDDAGVQSNGGDVFGLVYTSGPSDGSDLKFSISFAPSLPNEP